MDRKIDGNNAEENEIISKLVMLKELISVTEADNGVHEQDRSDFIEDFYALHLLVFEWAHLDQVH